MGKLTSLMNELKIEKSNIGKEKTLPSNIEAEQALIGSILVNNDIIDEISNIVSNKDFYDPLHAFNRQICLQILQTPKKPSSSICNGKHRCNVCNTSCCKNNNWTC